MDLRLPAGLGDQYKSASQKARVITEAWVRDNLRCPGCGGELLPYGANTKVYDFHCKRCGEKFQSKGQRGELGRSLLRGEYRTSLRRLLEGKQPSFILVGYDEGTAAVREVLLVHRYAIIPACLQARKKLSPGARRAGWQGFNLRLDRVKPAGKVKVVVGGAVVLEEEVMKEWAAASKLLKGAESERRWLEDVYECTDKLFAPFTLDQMYEFEASLGALHPDNNNVRAKIRQQLQVLRDLGFIEFAGRGSYRRLMGP